MASLIVPVCSSIGDSFLETSKFDIVLHCYEEEEAVSTSHASGVTMI